MSYRRDLQLGFCRHVGMITNIPQILIRPLPMSFIKQEETCSYPEEEQLYVGHSKRGKYKPHLQYGK